MPTSVYFSGGLRLEVSASIDDSQQECQQSEHRLCISREAIVVL